MKFFFNVYDEHENSDQTAGDFRDVREAKIEALQLTGCILNEFANEHWSGRKFRVDVEDENQEVVYCVEVFVRGGTAGGHSAATD